MAVKTAGIRHIHLLVADLERSIRFYGDAFGMKEKFRDGDDLVFLNTPGTHDSLALHLVRGDERAGRAAATSTSASPSSTATRSTTPSPPLRPPAGARGEGRARSRRALRLRPRPRRLRHRDLILARARRRR